MNWLDEMIKSGVELARSDDAEDVHRSVNYGQLAQKFSMAHVLLSARFDDYIKEILHQGDEDMYSDMTTEEVVLDYAAWLDAQSDEVTDLGSGIAAWIAAGRPKEGPPKKERAIVTIDDTNDLDDGCTYDLNTCKCATCVEERRFNEANPDPFNEEITDDLEDKPEVGPGSRFYEGPPQVKIDADGNEYEDFGPVAGEGTEQ
jgi:hypothetical protein